ncbi:hypothetical protein ISCGN_008686 [Ixodes scapularis]
MKISLSQCVLVSLVLLLAFVVVPVGKNLPRLSFHEIPSNTWDHGKSASQIGPPIYLIVRGRHLFETYIKEGLSGPPSCILLRLLSKPSLVQASLVSKLDEPMYSSRSCFGAA